MCIKDNMPMYIYTDNIKTSIFAITNQSRIMRYHTDDTAGTATARKAVSVGIVPCGENGAFHMLSPFVFVRCVTLARHVTRTAGMNCIW